LHTRQFEDARIGYAGMLSVNAQNLEILINEDNGSDAFKALLKNGSMAGKLYALCGLYFTDYAAFSMEVKKFRKSKEKVNMVSGRESFEESVARIVESDAPNVAIIGPGESLEQYLAGNAGRGYNIDIVNGGYQATFRHFVQKDKARPN
jgi:hypothetical protein